MVLAGKPNAGKSSLFNALVGKDAALVSAEPATTRDYLERTIDIDGTPVQLVDTAGLRPTDDSIDAAAQQIGQEQSGQADLVLWCVACDDPSNECAEAATRVATKTDLAPPPGDCLGTSASTGAGLPELRRHLAECARSSGHAPLAPSLSRCRHHVDASLAHLRQAHLLALNEEMPELLALELRLALDDLGAMAGVVYTDDLLDRIFSRFCIGK